MYKRWTIPTTYQSDSVEDRPESLTYVKVVDEAELEKRLLSAFAKALMVDDAGGWTTGRSILKHLKAQEMQDA